MEGRGGAKATDLFLSFLRKKRKKGEREEGSVLREKLRTLIKEECGKCRRDNFFMNLSLDVGRKGKEGGRKKERKGVFPSDP